MNDLERPGKESEAYQLLLTTWLLLPPIDPQSCDDFHLPNQVQRPDLQNPNGDGKPKHFIGQLFWTLDSGHWAARAWRLHLHLSNRAIGKINALHQWSCNVSQHDMHGNICTVFYLPSTSAKGLFWPTIAWGKYPNTGRTRPPTGLMRKTQQCEL